MIEAAERGLAADLLREFQPVPADLADALIYSDMTTGPGGQPTPVEQRLAEIQSRYGPGHLVSRSISQASPHLIAAVQRVEERKADFGRSGSRDPERALPDTRDGMGAGLVEDL